MTAGLPGWLPFGGQDEAAALPPPPWSPPERPQPAPDLQRRLRAQVVRHRRSIAALTAAVAVVATVGALRPAAPHTVPVVVAAHDLAAGRTLAAGDLATVAFPLRLVPRGALSTWAAVVGQLLTGPLPAGEPLTPAALAIRPPPGQSAVPVRLADGALGPLLAAGRRLDVYGAPADAAARLVAADVTVLTAVSSDGGEPGTLVVLSAPPPAAAALAAAADERLTVVLRR